MTRLPYLTACLALLPLGFVHADTRPDSHAPAGVMYEHLHRGGEWMVGYRTMYRRFDDLRHGSGDIDRADLPAEGYSGAPTNMTMTMHMLDIMYAPSDDLTLMLMPQYMTMDMSMASLGGGHGGHGGGMAHPGSHRHSVSGMGDTALAALYRLGRSGSQEFIGTLGVSVPTGDVHKKNPDGTFMHYGMQIGTGTWDLLPSLTWLGRRGRYSWGAQAGATLPLEEVNGAGFAFGERYYVTAWNAWRTTSWMSASLRIQYNREGDIDGHFDGPHNHASPPDRQANYGGESTVLGVGLNMAAQSGPLAGVRLGAEYLIPLRENLNGFQLSLEEGLTLSLSRAF